MQLEIGDGLLIRDWRAEDIHALARHANDRDIWINLRDSFPYPYTVKDAAAWVRYVSDQERETAFAIASPEEAIGGIGIRIQTDVYRKSAEIGYWLGKTYWGRGIITRAVRAFTLHCFDHFGLNRVWAGIFEWNPASVRVLEKAGYTFEGRQRSAVFKDGKIIDHLIYSIVRSDLD